MCLYWPLREGERTTLLRSLCLGSCKPHACASAWTVDRDPQVIATLSVALMVPIAKLVCFSTFLSCHQKRQNGDLGPQIPCAHRELLLAPRPPASRWTSCILSVDPGMSSITKQVRPPLQLLSPEPSIFQETPWSPVHC